MATSSPRMRAAFAPLAIALVLIAVPLHAQTPPAGGGAQRLTTLDANGDGAIDRSEAAKAPKLLAHFDRLDANRDGRITADERPHRGGHGGGGHRLATLDANGDGAIDRSEAAKAPKLLAHFDRLDADRDGRITADERPHRGGHGGKDGRGGQRLAKLDTDGDQRISRQEAAGHARLLERFDAIDSNRDGVVDREEIRRYREQHRGEGRGARSAP